MASGRVTVRGHAIGPAKTDWTGQPHMRGLQPAPTPPTAAIRLVVVDDHVLVLQSLARACDAAPDIEVVGTADSLRALESLFTEPHLDPQVVVMDYNLSDGSGIDGCRLVRARWPRARILMLSGSGGREDMVAAIEAGADGYLLKTCRIAVLLDAIRAAFAGELLLTPELIGEIARRLPGRHAEQVLLRPLTPRELTVLRLLSFGHSTKIIAKELELSPGTVRVHVEAIRRKFHVSTRLEAVSAAIQHHIVDVPVA